MKDNNQFSKISLDLPFWNDEKYLIPENPEDPMLFGFDWEEDDDLDEEQREKILRDARLEADEAKEFIQDLARQGIDINDLKQ